MKKLIYITSLSGKRLNSFMFSSLKAGLECGFEVHLACNFDSADRELYNADCNRLGIVMHNVPFERIPIHPKNIYAYFNLRKLIRGNNFSVIHCNTVIGGLITRLISGKKDRSKVIYQAHGFHFYKGSSIITWLVYYPIEYLLSIRTNYLITINQEDYLRSLSMKSQKKLLINGVGLNHYSTTFKKDSSTCIRIVSVGELNHNKNHITVIRALSKIKKEYIYTIYGEGCNRIKLEEYIKKHALQDKVLLPGYSNNIREELLKYDVFVFPSFREGLSVALMEAMDAKLACIISNIRGNRDLIDDFGGILCNPHDSNDFYLAILKLIDNPNLMSSMGEHNKKKVSKFYVEKVIGEIKSVYTEVGMINSENSSN
jgi:glycosyltransferase involved in cell wall biosynthesis